MDEMYASETLLRPDERKSVCEYTPCLIDRNKIPFKELWREANFFADDIICAVGTDFMQKIAEAEHRFICDMLNSLQQMEVVDAEPVVRCRDCKHYEASDFAGDILYGCMHPSGLQDITPCSFCIYGERRANNG